MKKSSVNEYKVYSQRWLIVVAFVCLNISNSAIWISFFPVASSVANFFDASIFMVDWFSFVYFLIPMMCFPLTTYLSTKKDLKFLLRVGSTINFIGALIKYFGISSFVHGKHDQYIICLTGQAIAAVAQSFGTYIPAKVSRTWFPKQERQMVTTILAISYSLGLTLTHLITPLYVHDETDVPRMVLICLIFSMFVQLISFLFVTRSHPKTPPSPSAENMMSVKVSYVSQVKEMFSFNSGQFLLSLGCAIGFISGLNTLTEQIICYVGYSDKIAGSCIAIMYCSGYFGSFLLNHLVKYVKDEELMLKIILAAAPIAFILLSEFMLLPGYPVLLLLSFALFGLFSVGVFPFSLEILVELTYPVDETITTGFAYLIGQSFGILMIFCVPALATEAKHSKHNVCKIDADNSSMDYSVPLSVFMAIFTFLFMFNVVFFKPIYKRKNYEKSFENKNDSSLFIISKPDNRNFEAKHME